MPRTPRNTKQRIVDTAYRVFYKEGFNRARLDVIAETAGVSKRTLYYHFTSKDALLAAVLDAQHELALARFQNWLDPDIDNPAEIVRVLFKEFAAWTRSPAWQGSGFTRSVMELADLPGHPSRAAARRHKAAVETWLAERLSGTSLANANQIARQIVLLLEGCHALILIHGDQAYATAAAEAAQLLVGSHAPS